jgi:hypothetical protein
MDVHFLCVLMLQEDFHTPLSEEISRLADTINAMTDEQWYLRERLGRHHKSKDVIFFFFQN